MNSAVVVSVDGSDASRAALRAAADRSLISGLPVHVRHTWQLTAPTAPSTDVAGYAQAGAADARARATRWVLEALGEDADRCRWTLEIVEGAPGERHCESAIV